MSDIFRIMGRFHAAPPCTDWREALAARLGARPRRVGIWAELGLYGAMECISAAGEAALPPEAGILVASRRGALSAVQTVLEQGRSELPMPLTFLQTQPSQMLALLAAHMGWSGDACFIRSRDPQDMLRLAAARFGTGGMLVGWVDEAGRGATSWLRLCPATLEGGGFRSAGIGPVLCGEGTYLRVTAAGLETLTT